MQAKSPWKPARRRDVRICDVVGSGSVDRGIRRDRPESPCRVRRGESRGRAGTGSRGSRSGERIATCPDGAKTARRDGAGSDRASERGERARARGRMHGTADSNRRLERKRGTEERAKSRANRRTRDPTTPPPGSERPGRRFGLRRRARSVVERRTVARDQRRTRRRIFEILTSLPGGTLIASAPLRRRVHDRSSLTELYSVSGKLRVKVLANIWPVIL